MDCSWHRGRRRCSRCDRRCGGGKPRKIATRRSQRVRDPTAIIVPSSPGPRQREGSHPSMTQTKISSSAVFFIFTTVLLDTIGFCIILPVLPGLIMELTGKGLSAAAIYGGWLWFVFAVLQFFCARLLGNLSDRYGRRPVILFSLFALGLDYLAMCLAPTIGWLFVGRAVAGMAGSSNTPAYAYLADIRPPQTRAQTFARAGSSFGTGCILWPAIGGVLGELGPRA